MKQALQLLNIKKKTVSCFKKTSEFFPKDLHIKLLENIICVH